MLFSHGDLEATLRKYYGEKIPSFVEEIPRDQLLATPEDDIVEHICSKLYLEAIQLYDESMEMEQVETNVDVSNDNDRNPRKKPGPIWVTGVKVIISIPYTGDSILWDLRTSPYQPVFPRGHVRPKNSKGFGLLRIVIEQPIDEPIEEIKKLFENELEIIKNILNTQKSIIENNNKSATEKIRQQIRHRKDSLKKHDGIAELLNIPLKRRHDAPSFIPVDVKRKLIKPLPPPPGSEYEPELGIEIPDYEHILSVIRHACKTFEATPRTYSVHDEEELRDIVLAHLNGHYHGNASGETFRNAGKTDIKIESKNRAAFVAECKVWRGQKELSSAVDQLLSYLTWRDCKASIIIFNKNNVNFSEILAKIPDTLNDHSRLKKFVRKVEDGEWEYVFMSENDDARLVFIRVFAFNIFYK